MSKNVSETAISISRSTQLLPKWSISDLIINLLVPVNNRPFMKLLYGYIRWVDDTIDESSLSNNERIAFANRQIELLKNFYRGTTHPDSCSPEELFLYHIVSFDKNNADRLYLPFQMMLDAFKFDAIRLGGKYIPTQDELDSYFSNIGEGAMRLTNGIAFPNIEFENHDVYLLGKASEIAHMLRDFEEDIQLGIFNICKEDIEIYNLEPSKVENQLPTAWLEKNILSCWQLFEVSSKALNQVQSTIARLSWRLFSIKYKIILLRLNAKIKGDKSHIIMISILKMLFQECIRSIRLKQHFSQEPEFVEE